MADQPEMPDEEGECLMTFEQYVLWAESRIAIAEKELGLLTSGQRRDLLKDNSDWSSDLVEMVVSWIDERDAARWRALTHCARIRVRRTANVEPSGAFKNPREWVHAGMEFWSVYPSFEVQHEGQLDERRSTGVAALTALAEHVMHVHKNGFGN